MIECSHCHFQTNDIDGFCEHCGRPLHIQVTEPGTGGDEPEQGGDKPEAEAGVDYKKIIIIIGGIVVALGLLFFIFSNIDSSGSITEAPVAEEKKASADEEQQDSEYDQKQDDPNDTSEEAKTALLEDTGEGSHLEGRFISALKSSPEYQNFSSYFKSDRVSYVTYDVTTNEYTGANASEAMSASALVSIPILYTVAAEVDAGRLSLYEEVRFTHSVDGRGKLNKNNDGEYISIMRLLEYMMGYSDNNATNTLIDYIGMDTIAETCQGFGYNSVSVGGRIMETKDYTSNDNYVSAADIASMLADLYNDKFDSIGKKFLLENMVIQDDTGREGLGETLGGVIFLNMNGIKKDKYNEIALIDDEPYIYINVIFSSGDDYHNLQICASEFGKMVDSIVKKIK